MDAPVYSVLTEHGARYGHFNDYELALGQAEHLASPRRRLRQVVTLQAAATPQGPWRDLLVYERDGALRQAPPASTVARPRLSPLAA